MWFSVSSASRYISYYRHTAIIFKGMSVHRHINSGPNFGPYVWISSQSRICPVIWRSTCFAPLPVYCVALFVCLLLRLPTSLPLYLYLCLCLSLSLPYCKNINNNLVTVVETIGFSERLKFSVYVYCTGPVVCLISGIVSKRCPALYSLQLLYYQ